MLALRHIRAESSLNVGDFLCAIPAQQVTARVQINLPHDLPSDPHLAIHPDPRGQTEINL